MRKANVIMGTLLILLTPAHLILGTLQIAGVLQFGAAVSIVISIIYSAVLAVHIVIGVILSLITARTIRTGGTSYTKENMLFWIRRISGFLIIVFAIDHVLFSLGAFGFSFTPVHYAASILLVASLAVHVVTDVRPVMAGLGMSRGRKAILICMLLVLAVSAAAMTAMFIGGE